MTTVSSLVALLLTGFVCLSSAEAKVIEINYEGESAKLIFDFMTDPLVQAVDSDASHVRVGFAFRCDELGGVYHCVQRIDTKRGDVVPNLIDSGEFGPVYPSPALVYSGPGAEQLFNILGNGPQRMDDDGNFYKVGKYYNCSREDGIASCRQWLTPTGYTFGLGYDPIIPTPLIGSGTHPVVLPKFDLL